MGDVIDDIGDAVGGAVEAVGNTATAVVDWAAEAAESSVEFVAASAEAAVNIGASVATGDWDGVVDAGENFGGALVDHFEDLGESVVSAAGIAANLAGETFQATVPQGLLEAVDDVGVFDVVNTVSGGLVDVKAEDGKFDFQIGDPDVFGIGVHSSAEGFDSDFNVGVVGGHVASNADGSFDIGADVGVNWGPLPNFGAHVSQDAAGDIGVSGRAELYIPTPAGLVGGEVEGAFQETPEGFEVSGSATGRYFSPAGGYVGAGVHGAYGEDAEGYHANIGVHGEVGIVGGPEVRATIDYNEGREGDVSYQGVSTSAQAQAYGMQAGVSGSYTHVETPDGEFDAFEGAGSLGGFGQKGSIGGSVLSGPQGTTTNFDAAFDGGLGSLDVDGLAKAAGSALDAFGVDGAGDIASGIGTAGRLAQGAGGVLGGDLSQLGALGGQLGGVFGDEDSILGTVGGALGGLAGGGGAGDVLGAAKGLLGDAFDDAPPSAGAAGSVAGDGLGGAGADVGSLANDGFGGGVGDAGFYSGYAADVAPPTFEQPTFEQPAFEQAAYGQPDYEAPPTEFAQNIAEVDAAAETLDNLFDGL
jgi:hypothetical protein